MKHNKITPALWYHTADGKIQEVLDYYAQIFSNNFKSQATIPLGETLNGHTEMCNISLFGNEYFLMTTAIEHHQFNDSLALMIHCQDQDEIDSYWDYFTAEGEASMCGWCRDKYGLRWQILPENLGELMARPHAGAVMAKQGKIVIAEY